MSNIMLLIRACNMHHIPIISNINTGNNAIMPFLVLVAVSVARSKNPWSLLCPSPTPGGCQNISQDNMTLARKNGRKTIHTRKYEHHHTNEQDGRIVATSCSRPAQCATENVIEARRQHVATPSLCVPQTLKASACQVNGRGRVKNDLASDATNALPFACPTPRSQPHSPDTSADAALAWCFCLGPA